jgi:hypothetical protein
MPYVSMPTRLSGARVRRKYVRYAAPPSLRWFVHKLPLAGPVVFIELSRPGASRIFFEETQPWRVE